MKRKRQIIIIAVLALLVTCAAVCGIVYRHYGGILQSQQAARRFTGGSEERFSQVSVFFPVGSGITYPTVMSFRETIDSKLLEVSMESTEESILSADGYSATAQVTVRSSKTSATIQATGIGGDYFLFHPLTLKNGGYISESDLMHDRVVLDYELAWKLFGSADLEGMEIEINGDRYIIAGVVEREDDFASTRAYPGGEGIFMAYDALNSITETNISCYELVMANPISGFAKSVAESGFPGGVTVENTGRYSLSSIFSVISDFGDRSMNSAGVIYPYWENAARLLEDYCALALILCIIFSCPPAIVAIAALWILARRAVKRLIRKVPDIIDGINERRYNRKLAKEEQAKGA